MKSIDDIETQQPAASCAVAVTTPHQHDILCRRGNYECPHAGNEHFRALVRMHKVVYVAAPKHQKPLFAQQIVDAIKSLKPPGRFLKQDTKTRLWYEIDDRKAIEKTRQALREGAPRLTRQLLGSQAEERKRETKRSKGNAVPFIEQKDPPNPTKK